MPYYRDRYHLEADAFPETMARFNSLISLPLWPGMNEEQIARVIDAVKTGIAEL
jgi:dTDP-4-amino-4,6-dideoxygalactose transaminase